MFSLLEENRLVEQTPRTVNFLLGLYRRSPHPPRYKISEALSTVLQIAPPVPLEPMLDNIIHTLHAMVGSHAKSLFRFKINKSLKFHRTKY